MKQVIIAGQKSSNEEGAESSIDCPRGTMLTDCTCFSDFFTCLGSRIDDGVCKAFNRNRCQTQTTVKGCDGVVAYATCLDIGNADYMIVEGVKKGTSPSSIAECGPEYDRTGCTCFSEGAACGGIQVNQSSCEADIGLPGRNIVARAVCVEKGTL